MNAWRADIAKGGVARDRAIAELTLGDAAQFFPSDAALASWRAQAEQGHAEIAYD
jgi:DNA polymerase-3 subunit alpha